MDTVNNLPQHAAGASKKVADYVSALRYDQLPVSAVHAFKRALLDYLTCAIAGSRMAPTKIVFDYVSSWDQSREASVMGTTSRLSCPNAAFVNGTSTHGLDFDDGYTRGSVHPAGAVFPALLAIAEKQHSSAKDVIAAGVAGYDVTARIAATMHPSSAKRGFHNTPTAGVLGAAAGVSRLLSLDAKTTLDAMGIAGSFSSGLREYLFGGAEVKRIHPGKAARDGITCAELAKRGLTGPEQVLEGKHGLFNALAGGDVVWGRMCEALGERFEIAHVYFKPYPACRHFHAALDAVRDLRKKHSILPADVARIDVGMYEVGARGHDHRHAHSLLDAQMSAPVSTALAMMYGDVTVGTYDTANIQSADVQRLIGLTTAGVDVECERIYPGRRSGVAKITLNDGQSFEQRVLDPRGEVENPMTDEDLAHKFRSNCEPMVGKAKCDRMLELVWSFEKAASLDELYNG
ncbi:MAG: MmgE/PrpD family protein [Burkholderiales bacterium]